MRVVSRRAVYGDADPVVSTNGDSSQLNLRVQPSVAAGALELWVLAGVLTHVAIRFVDRWFEGK